MWSRARRQKYLFGTSGDACVIFRKVWEMDITFCFKSTFCRQIFSWFEHCFVWHVLWTVSVKLYQHSVCLMIIHHAQLWNKVTNTRRHDYISGESHGGKLHVHCNNNLSFQATILMWCVSLELPQFILLVPRFYICCMACLLHIYSTCAR